MLITLKNVWIFYQVWQYLLTNDVFTFQAIYLENIAICNEGYSILFYIFIYYCLINKNC